jgi:2-oxoglutarate ferredoxin oxidoreductase subunit alpha
MIRPFYSAKKNADVTIVSWGSNKGIILDVMDRLKKEGKKVNFLYIRMMVPFPTDFVTSILKNSKMIIDVENNYTGQLAMLIKQNCAININKYLLKYNGRHPTEDEVYEGIKKLIDGKSNRVVMTNGA